MKRISKYKTGEKVPYEAIYLNSLVTGSVYVQDVSHYFLVEE